MPTGSCPVCGATITFSAQDKAVICDACETAFHVVAREGGKLALRRAGGPGVQQARDAEHVSQVQQTAQQSVVVHVHDRHGYSHLLGCLGVAALIVAVLVCAGSAGASSGREASMCLSAVLLLGGGFMVFRWITSRM